MWQTVEELEARKGLPPPKGLRGSELLKVRLLFRAAWCCRRDGAHVTQTPPPLLSCFTAVQWAKYIEAGGAIYPMNVFTPEGAPVPIPETDGSSSSSSAS